MILGGVEFEVIKPTSYIPPCKGQLEDCYSKPSDCKKRIMSDWWFWANSIPGTVKMWVSSYNIYFFTLGGEIWNTDNKHYAFYITRTRNANLGGDLAWQNISFVLS